MRPQSIVIVLFAIIFYGVNCLSFDQSLSSCEQAAAKFANTCTGGSAWSSLSSVPDSQTETISCTGMTKCPDSATATSGTCSWKRKLCVTCRESAGNVYIRVQTNALPHYCYAAPATVKDQDLDFEVIFNPKASSSAPQITFSSTSEINAQMCSINQVSKTSSIPSTSDFTLKGTSNADTLVGVSIKGMALFNPNSIEDEDPHYPSSGDSEKVDTCMGHPQAAGVYHQHMLSPCVFSSSVSGSSPLKSDAKTQAQQGFTSSNKKASVYGIAKDGHLIVSPYNDNGELISTMDACNGNFLDDGSYTYVASLTFPYFAGCWGPGKLSSSSLKPTCTTNAFTPSDSAASLTQVSFILVILQIVVFILGVFQ